MQTKLSSKGQVVLPEQIRKRLGLHAGDALDASVEGERVVLTPHRRRYASAKIIAHPITGLPVLSAGEDAPVLTSKEVAEILADFP